MRKLIVSLLVAALVPILQGCAAAALAGPVFGGLTFLGLNKYGNDQRNNCAALYDKAVDSRWSDAKTKAEAYRAGCR